MKMKISLILLVTLVLCVASNASEISLRVVDERDEPMEGVDVLISFAHPQQKDKGYRGKTDNKGHYSAKGRNTVGILARVTRQGYYDWERRKGFGQKDHDLTVVMRKVKKPIPLYVREMKLEFPTYDEWLGFDFEAGDWTAPHGRGKSRDILFKLNREYAGSQYSEKELVKIIPRVKKIAKDRNKDWNAEDFKIRTAKWDSKFFIGFPSDFEGMVEAKDDYLAYSKLKMPHLAPEGGYRNEEVVVEKKSPKRKSNKEEMEEIQKYIKFGDAKPSGYFIRTRVNEVNGKIIKANYVKLNKAIEVDVPRNRVVFTYYFNPKANDRSLEFNPMANLATEQKRAYDP